MIVLFRTLCVFLDAVGRASSRRTRIGHLVFGSGFDRCDLLAYAAGVLATVLLEQRVATPAPDASVVNRARPIADARDPGRRAADRKTLWIQRGRGQRFTRGAARSARLLSCQRRRP